MHYIDAIVKGVSSLSPVIIHFFLFISAFTENICPPIPGDTIIAFGAFLAAQGKVNFLIAYLSTTIGSLSGFMFVFWLGTHLGGRLNEKYPFFKTQDIKKAEQWLKKYGYLIILVNRYLPAIRAAVSFTSGLLQLSSFKVMTMAFIGCATWNLLVMYAGFNIGSNWEEIKYRFNQLLFQYNTTVLTVLFFFIIIFFTIKQRKKIF